MPKNTEKHKSAIEAFKGGDTNNRFMRELSLAHVYMYPRDWSETITKVGKVINPANLTDLTDIGTLDDDGAFVADNKAEVKKVLSLHWIRRNRKTNAEVLKAYRLSRGLMTEDHVGKSRDQLKEDISSAADIESRSELGDPEDDTID